MAAEIKILVEGFLEDNSTISTSDDRVQPTITLVKDEGVILVVDPGIVDDKEILIDALADEGLAPSDVNFVCITHSHFAHYKNVGMFENAKVLEYFGVWNGSVLEKRPAQLTKNIKIMPTPGHDHTNISLFVKTSPNSKFPGTVAICGDVFWKEDYPESVRELVYVPDVGELEASRKLVLENSDWVIPGHGGIYKNDESFASAVNGSGFPSKSRELSASARCKKCDRILRVSDRCECRNYFCRRCCECEMDCNFCSCSHKVFKGAWDND